jgi:hypothetical protein
MFGLEAIMMFDLFNVTQMDTFRLGHVKVCASTGIYFEADDSV